MFFELVRFWFVLSQNLRFESVNECPGWILRGSGSVVEHLTSPDVVKTSSGVELANGDAICPPEQIRFVDPTPISFWIRGRQNVLSRCNENIFSLDDVQNFENGERHHAKIVF